MPYGIVLLPSPDLAVRLVGYAASIGAPAPALMRLGPGEPAHITLVHGQCTGEAAMCWWRATNADLVTVSAQLVGVMLAPVPAGNYYIPEGGIYVGIEVFPARPLTDLHRSVLRGAASHGVTAVGQVGDNYRPHLTLAVFTAGPLVVPELPADLVTATIETRLALGRLGPYGTFPEIIACA